MKLKKDDDLTTVRNQKKDDDLTTKATFKCSPLYETKKKMMI